MFFGYEAEMLRDGGGQTCSVVYLGAIRKTEGGMVEIVTDFEEVGFKHYEGRDGSFQVW